MHFDLWRGLYPHGILLLGLLLLIFATIGILQGKAFTRWGRTDRFENPVEYWTTLLAQSLVGLFLLGYWALLMMR